MMKIFAEHFITISETQQLHSSDCRYGSCVRTPNCWLASQCASGRSCGRPAISKFSVVFLGPRANAETVPKIHFALCASYAPLPEI